MLGENFYSSYNTINLAKELLGKVIVSITPEGKVSGRIVETEAYLADDPASHSFTGKNNRNKSMFKRAGTAYVYFIYGVHYCFNVAAMPEGIGEAVLIRAVEPLTGLGLMKKRRNFKDIKNLANGPGKVCQALGIDLAHDGIELFDSGNLYLTDPLSHNKVSITESKRIGISKGKNLPLRFYLKGNEFVSGR